MNEVLHGSAFVYAGVGCLVLGPSGSGKSTLMAEALLHGAQFLADDQVALRADTARLIAAPVPKIEGLLELRGIALIRVPSFIPEVLIRLVVELTEEEVERLPVPNFKVICGISVPLLVLPQAPNTPIAALLLYLQAMQENRILPEEYHPNRG